MGIMQEILFLNLIAPALTQVGVSFSEACLARTSVWQFAGPT
jgi:hypothetical protein